MQILFGQEVETRLQSDKVARVPKSEFYPDCFQSEPLCAWQSEMHARGICRVELVETVFGYGLRYASGLDGFAVLAGVRDGQLDGSLESALNYARDWQAQAETKRVVFTRVTLPASVI